MSTRNYCAVGLLLPMLLFSVNALGDDLYEDDLAADATSADTDLPPAYFNREDALLADDLVRNVSAERDLSIYEEFDEMELYSECACDECNAKGGGCDVGCCYCSRFWIRGEYLMWWTTGMRIPPLVTTSIAGTPVGDQGVLGLSSTQILLGNEKLFSGLRSGGRMRLGWWLDDCQQCGIEGDFLGLANKGFNFRRNCFDNEILARPFFNVDPMLPNGPENDAECVCCDDILFGAVTVNANTSFWSAGARFRRNLCSSPTPCGDTRGQRKDFLLGYRFLRLGEDLSIREELNTLQAPVTNFDLVDRFDTSSEFHGVEFGMLWGWQQERLSLESIVKVALGSSHHEVDINGRTITQTVGMPRTEKAGGLLTQPSNIGRYEKNSFAAAAQFDLTLGYKITQDLRFTFGYSLIYWSTVVRPGDQVDLTVNAKFLDPAIPFDGPSRPAFNFKESDYWAQGLNFGLELRL